MTTTDDIERHYETPASTLEVGDQIIIEDELVKILTLDDDREDIDEIFITVENLSGGDDSFELYADDLYWVWSI